MNASVSETAVGTPANEELPVYVQSCNECSAEDHSQMLGGIVFIIMLPFILFFASTWYLIFWAAQNHCSDATNQSTDDEQLNCEVEMILGNIAVWSMCAACGLVASICLYCLRMKTTKYRNKDVTTPRCDLVRVNTMVCMWIGLLAVWVLQYVMIFVVREPVLSCLVPSLQLVVIVAVYLNDYYIGSLTHRDA